MACSGLAVPRRFAVVLAVVVMKKVDCRDAPLEMFAIAGTNLQVSPAVRTPQERDSVPL
jgi:hypothetical protein